MLSNARSRICFQLAADDAALVAKTSRELVSEDFQELGRFEAYASLVANGNVTPFASIRTAAPTAPSQEPSLVRAVSRKRYGVALSEVEASLAALVGASDSAHDEPPAGRRRRA